jgi:hypothetical protein
VIFNFFSTAKVPLRHSFSRALFHFGSNSSRQHLIKTHLTSLETTICKNDCVLNHLHWKVPFRTRFPHSPLVLQRTRILVSRNVLKTPILAKIISAFFVGREIGVQLTIPHDPRQLKYHNSTTFHFANFSKFLPVVQVKVLRFVMMMKTSAFSSLSNQEDQ